MADFSGLAYRYTAQPAAIASQNVSADLPFYAPWTLPDSIAVDPQPTYRVETTAIDWFRIGLFVLGIAVGATVLKRGR